jgi:hypothetical protein
MTEDFKFSSKDSGIILVRIERYFSWILKLAGTPTDKENKERQMR